MRCILSCLLLLLLASCRKDLILFHSATRLETHTTNRLNRILFINDSLGFACGGSRFDEADVLITRDGGASWQLYISPEAHKELFGITKAPDGSVWLIGFDGNLLCTRDGGNSWKRFQLRYEAYKALAFQDDAHFMAVGGISFERGDVMRVDTLGQVLSHDSLGYELNDIAIFPNGQGWRCGYGVMQHTLDGGRSWQWQSIRNDNFKAIDILDAKTAFTCGGEGSVCATKDGGNSWETLRNGNDFSHPKYRLQDILFLDAQFGYAVGEDGVMIYSDDGGKHWSELKRFTDAHLYGIAKNAQGQIFVCGDGGAIWRIEP